MHVFVTGGSGLTGPTVVTELIAAGHTVTGLARSDAAADRLAAIGATPHRGSLDDLDALRRGAEAADGVLHMGFGGDFADPDGLIRRDRTAIETLGAALRDSGKPFVSTSGTLVMPEGRETTEHDEPDTTGRGYFRIPGEQACLGFAAQGVRASVVRLAPTVHGPGDYGFIGMLVVTARRTGVSAYIGDGANRWPAVHRLDAAKLFRLALEKAPAGSVLHGAAESGVTLKSIADTIANALGIQTVSLTPEEAVPHFEIPFMAAVYAADAPVSSSHTRQLLDWTPTHPTLLEDLRHGDYFASDPAQQP
ncbi:nucleoside-diphosphate-sugar epimerase [Nocardia tenerifensis]|uniref:Nucleoside-diphosphate-sugar epimerase n=1 Tax=Nocardia tenerifensis TaxID=228006 RepID=A0A318JWN2_9NOCA|nr:SDR family oxidoreductase [Nocardia tenerifensis]PXX61690.1 nucleoside-diphosphate-sugar epimerase [Nocardia tenerifensis]